MNRAQYLADDVTAFRDWLAQRLGGQPVHFSAPQSRSYVDLTEALAAYTWPRTRKAGLANPHNGFPYIHPVVNRLQASSNLAANAAVLQVLQGELRKAYAAGPCQVNELAGAAAAVLHWGGVYTTTPHGGNKPWLAANYIRLHGLLRAVVQDHALGDDCSKVTDLRFNSGMTKVYSLLIDDFIMYDSRVAASLAWLVLRWWTVIRGQPLSNLPARLRFGCPPGNGAASGHRNPASRIFPLLKGRPYEHYTWNVRANWLLLDTLRVAGAAISFRTLRQVEAALFQMGARVI